MSFQQALSGLNAASRSLDVIGHNIANAGTTGMKSSRAEFAEIYASSAGALGGTNVGLGVEVGAVAQQFSQGTLSITGNDLDLAITGEGFFKILMPDGTYQYTRDGTMQQDATGRIVNAQGNPLQPTITIPQNSTGLTVNAQGQVSVTLPGSSTTSTIIGQIGLTRFINKAGLQPVGSNLYTDTPASGAPQDGLASAEGYGTLTQGSLEQSNVDVVSEMSNLIAAQRAYEMNAKVISAADQMMQSTSALFR